LKDTHTDTHRDRDREGQRDKHTEFFLGEGGWGVGVVTGPTTEMEFVWGARKQDWVEVVKSGFFCNNWVIRVYIKRTGRGTRRW
jgi:hypothetical protein